jgi:hypothetical protein
LPAATTFPQRQSTPWMTRVEDGRCVTATAFRLSSWPRDTVAIKQYRSLLSGLQTIGPQRGRWSNVFVGGTCRSVNEETFNTNLELLDIPEGKWNHLRQRMAKRLLEVQDTVLRAYFAQKYGEKPTCGGGEGSTAGPRGLAHLGGDVYA